MPMIKRAFEMASCNAVQPVLTRKAQAVQDAVESGQNVSAVIKREEAIEQAEIDMKMRLLEFAG
jgi:hypothetical protein|nr:MAG TPA: hypothetical protein [Caudoviricetes sp.]